MIILTSSAIAISDPHRLRTVPHSSQNLEISTSKLHPATHDLQERRIAITDLPQGWTGQFSHFQSCRPSIPVALIFIRFFTIASQRAPDATDFGQTMRFALGPLVLEMIGQDILTTELVQAVTLFLLHKAERGWTGFFEATVRDVMDGSIIFLRLGTIWDFPDVVSNSPWD